VWGSVPLFQPGHLGGCQRDIESRYGVVDVLDLGGAHRRRDDPRTIEQPRQCDLRGRQAPFACDFGEGVNDVEVGCIVELVGEGVAASPDGWALPIAGSRAGEQAPGQRAPWDEADAHVQTQRDQLAFCLPVEQVVVALRRR